jgi:hypothetical protein
MNERKNEVKDVLEEFRKTTEELTKTLAAEKQNALQIQIDNLRQDVKELQAEAIELKKPTDP